MSYEPLGFVSVAFRYSQFRLSSLDVGMFTFMNTLRRWAYLLWSGVRMCPDHQMFASASNPEACVVSIPNTAVQRLETCKVVWLFLDCTENMKPSSDLSQLSIGCACWNHDGKNVTSRWRNTVNSDTYWNWSIYESYISPSIDFHRGERGGSSWTRTLFLDSYLHKFVRDSEVTVDRIGNFVWPFIMLNWQA